MPVVAVSVKEMSVREAVSWRSGAGVLRAPRGVADPTEA